MEEDDCFVAYRRFLGIIGTDVDRKVTPYQISLHDQIRSTLSDQTDIKLIAGISELGADQGDGALIVRNLFATEFARRHGQQVALYFIQAAILQAISPVEE